MKRDTAPSGNAEIEYMDAGMLDVDGEHTRHVGRNIPAETKSGHEIAPYITEEDDILYIHDTEAPEIPEIPEDDVETENLTAPSLVEDTEEDSKSAGFGSGESFDLDQIGTVDLREAEEIANETLLMINEKDLYEELDELHDLLKEAGRKDGFAETKETHEPGTDSRPFFEKESPSPGEERGKRGKEAPKTVTAEKSPDADVRGIIREMAGRNQAGSAGERKDGVSPQAKVKSQFPEKTAGKEAAAVTGDKDLMLHPAGEVKPDSAPEKHGRDDRLHGESSVKAQPAEEEVIFMSPDDEMFGEATPVETEVKPEEKAAPMTLETEEAPVPAKRKVEQEVSSKVIGESDSEKTRVHSAVDRSEGAAYYIDGETETPSLGERRDQSELRELDRITADLVSIEVGSALLLTEADTVDYKDQGIPISQDFGEIKDEFIFEFIDDFKYRDNELDYIHTAIIQDDYNKYLMEIDEFQKTKGTRGLTRAVEILGLTDEELSGVHGALFSLEYKDVDLHEIFDFFREDSTKRDLGPSIVKECTYIVTRKESLGKDDRASIEDDISTPNALVYEEDIDMIRNLLKKTVPEPKPPAAGREDDRELRKELKDITDRVVIIEDEGDIDRFVNEFPDVKRGSLKKLMMYLDGLFEKLPESTIKTFANSEYFDLYIKVMNDLEV